MARTLAKTVGAMALALSVSAPAMAQSGVEVETGVPKPPPKFEIIRPEAPGSEITRPRDADIYTHPMGEPYINYDPAFIEPFTKETETGRVGLAGWGSPQGVPPTQDGPSSMRVPGFLSFGFAVTWGGPVRKTGPAAATPPPVSR